MARKLSFHNHRQASARHRPKHRPEASSALRKRPRRKPASSVELNKDRFSAAAAHQVDRSSRNRHLLLRPRLRRLRASLALLKLRRRLVARRASLALRNRHHSRPPVRFSALKAHSEISRPREASLVEDQPSVLRRLSELRACLVDQRPSQATLLAESVKLGSVHQLHRARLSISKHRPSVQTQRLAVKPRLAVRSRTASSVKQRLDSPTVSSSSSAHSKVETCSATSLSSPSNSSSHHSRQGSVEVPSPAGVKTLR